MARLLNGVLLLALFASGCALLINGSTQPVHFNSDPPGATISANGQAMGTTPATVNLQRCGKYDVTFDKPGYKSTSVHVAKDTSLWTLIDGWFILPLYGPDLYGCSYDKFSPNSYQVTMQQAR